MDSHVLESTCWWLWPISTPLWSEPLMQTIWLRAGNFALLILLLLIYYSLTFDVLYIYMHPLDGVTLSCYVPICRLTDFVNRILVLNLNLSCLVSPIYKWTLQYPTLQETRGLWRWRSVRALKDTQDLLARYIALTLNSNTLSVWTCVSLSWCKNLPQKQRFCLSS